MREKWKVKVDQRIDRSLYNFFSRSHKRTYVGVFFSRKKWRCEIFFLSLYLLLAFRPAWRDNRSRLNSNQFHRRSHMYVLQSILCEIIFRFYVIVPQRERIRESITRQNYNQLIVTDLNNFIINIQILIVRSKWN